MITLVKAALQWAAAELSEPHASYDAELELYEDMMEEGAVKFLREKGYMINRMEKS